MYLGYGLLSQIFPETTGIKDPMLMFHTVTSDADADQPRGLFIPLWGNGDDLKKALNNGAVAAIWEKGQQVPSYTPNHFPVFYTNNLWEDVKKMLEIHIEMVKQEKEVKQMSKFIDTGLLNEKIKTYDSSDKIKQILELIQTLEGLRGE